MKSRQTRKLVMYGLMVAILVTSVAYAALQTVLNISGTITKKGGNWNIYFTNVSNPTITGKAEMVKPSLEGTTNLSFSATLEQPLDKAVFTVDVVNGGSLDASLSSILLTGVDTAKDADISYTVTYADGTPIRQYDALKKDQTRTLKVTVEYDNVDSVTDEEVALNLGLTLIYIQGSESDIQNGEGSLGVTDTSLAAEPNLLNNSLTPVVYDETANSGAGSWKIADTTKQWYNYSTQQWANAVILNSGVSTTPGTLIDVETQAKAMYVWIPRYEYKIEGTYGTHTDGSAGTAALPGEIKVNFIPTSQTTASSGYILHSAFTWDNNDNGSISADEHISGIWVGKFETSANTTSTCYTSPSSNNCNNTNQEPRILPNAKSLTYQNVSNQFATAQKFAIYLTNSANIDSHMMKNSEWGAVAYLSQSIYGKYGNSMYTGANKEIYKNNSYSSSTGIITGRSSGLPQASGYSATGTCSYSDIIDRGSGTGSCGGGASTTGNIYGVYDMSGGASEHVMGYLTIANSNYSTNPNSYFGWTSSSNKAGFTYKPADKYFDAYTSEDSSTGCNGGICYGHALSETSGWYSDPAAFISANHPWFIRGASSISAALAGVFDLSGSRGDASSIYSFRSVFLATGA